MLEAASQDSGLAVFLLSAMVISLSGVMMPGPVFAVTVTKGRESPLAGTWIAIGHGLIEMPLMILIYAGVARFLASEVAQMVIGVVGGLFLLWMGAGMLGPQAPLTSTSRRPASPVLAGLLTTVGNPYFFLWWVTVGSLLISRSLVFGLLGFVALAIVHSLCDFGWETVVSAVTYRSRKLWNPVVHRVVFALCGLTLIGFGLYFGITVVV